MSTIITGEQTPVAAARKGRSAGCPSQRNCRIYERVMLDGDTYEAVGVEYAISRQRIAAIVARVEGWIAAHPQHNLARKMRVECARRWQAIWSRAIESFDRSQQDRRTTKERAARRRHGLAGEQTPLATVSEQTVREQNGDPRFLTIAARVAERQDRLWVRDRERTAGPGRGREEKPNAGPPAPPSVSDGAGPQADAQRLAYLPAALGNLQQLACGLSHDRSAPISTLFERRCAEAFRCLGFEVRELGQGCGRVADCLAVAPAERFAVIIDAKVRRRGYTLGTDDRQFCEYATRHARELALTGIERIYFAVIGQGFRQEDLDKLAEFMTGAPIRSVVFIEASALMRLVHESICDRRQFRLGDIDRLLFGNKIID
ncbi:MAG TPA: hypothetical protein VFI31_21020 [Pirellulales bacterium]|nr:hypothetical protein [Pirellulales bacterium]